MIKLIVFLGNYGSEYAQTRHNAAWLFEESLPISNILKWENKFNGIYAALKISQTDIFSYSNIFEKININPPKNLPEKFFFLKPHTYMNNSGISVAALADFYKIKPEEILIIHDEIEIPFGYVSLKWAGGLGGHNGLRSVKNLLGTQEFWRLRLGVGKPKEKEIAAYVLNQFNKEEKELLPVFFSEAAKPFFNLLFSSNTDKLLQEWKKKKVIQQ